MARQEIYKGYTIEAFATEYPDGWKPSGWVGTAESGGDACLHTWDAENMPRFRTADEAEEYLVITGKVWIDSRT